MTSEPGRGEPPRRGSGAQGSEEGVGPETREQRQMAPLALLSHAQTLNQLLIV